MALNPPDDRPPADRINEYFAGEAGRQRYLKLLHYTERKVRSMHWCIPTADDSMPGGKQACDIMHETLQFLQSKAPPEKGGHNYLPPDIEVEVAFKKVICREINHAAESFENATRNDNVGVDREGEEIDHLESDAPFWEPAQTKLSPQQIAHIAARCERFVEFSRKDRDVCNMLIIIRDRGIDGPAERMAKELGIRITEVYAARRRLGSLLRKFGKSVT